MVFGYHLLLLKIFIFNEFPDWLDDILQLAIKFKDEGVVGIDMAGPSPPRDDKRGTYSNLISK